MMAWLISKQERSRGVAFYHIPKTGGKWLEEACKAAGLTVRSMTSAPGVHNRHAPPQFVIDRSKLERSMHSFCSVRNPLDWYASWWRYRNGHGRDADVGPNCWYVFSGCPNPRDMPFDAWIQEMMMFEPALMTRAVEWYVGPLSAMGRMTDWSVLRMEDFPQAPVALLIRYLGISSETAAEIENYPQVNVSVVETPEWNTHQRRELVQLEAPIFKEWY